MEKIYYVYVIRTDKDTLYTGITTDIQRRMKEHISRKSGAKYTRQFKIIKIEIILEALGRSNASRIEWYFKQFSKKEKENFIKNPSILIEKILQDLEITAKINKELLKSI